MSDKSLQERIASILSKLDINLSESSKAVLGDPGNISSMKYDFTEGATNDVEINSLYDFMAFVQVNGKLPPEDLLPSSQRQNYLEQLGGLKDVSVDDVKLDGNLINEIFREHESYGTGTMRQEHVDHATGTAFEKNIAVNMNDLAEKTVVGLYASRDPAVSDMNPNAGLQDALYKIWENDPNVLSEPEIYQVASLTGLRVSELEKIKTAVDAANVDSKESVFKLAALNAIENSPALFQHSDNYTALQARGNGTDVEIADALKSRGDVQVLVEYRSGEHKIGDFTDPSRPYTVEVFTDQGDYLPSEDITFTADDATYEYDPDNRNVVTLGEGSTQKTYVRIAKTATIVDGDGESFKEGVLQEDMQSTQYYWYEATAQTTDAVPAVAEVVDADGKVTTPAQAAVPASYTVTPTGDPISQDGTIAQLNAAAKVVIANDGISTVNHFDAELGNGNDIENWKVSAGANLLANHYGIAQEPDIAESLGNTPDTHKILFSDGQVAQTHITEFQKQFEAYVKAGFITNPDPTPDNEDTDDVDESDDNDAIGEIQDILAHVSKNYHIDLEDAIEEGTTIEGVTLTTGEIEQIKNSELTYRQLIDSKISELTFNKSAFEELTLPNMSIIQNKGGATYETILGAYRSNNVLVQRNLEAEWSNLGFDSLTEIHLKNSSGSDILKDTLEEVYGLNSVNSTTSDAIIFTVQSHPIDEQSALLSSLDIVTENLTEAEISDLVETTLDDSRIASMSGTQKRTLLQWLTDKMTINTNDNSLLKEEIVNGIYDNFLTKTQKDRLTLDTYDKNVNALTEGQKALLANLKTEYEGRFSGTITGEATINLSGAGLTVVTDDASKKATLDGIAESIAEGFDATAFQKSVLTSNIDDWVTGSITDTYIPNIKNDLSTHFLSGKSLDRSIAGALPEGTTLTTDSQNLLAGSPLETYITQQIKAQATEMARNGVINDTEVTNSKLPSLISHTLLRDRLLDNMDVAKQYTKSIMSEITGEYDIQSTNTEVIKLTAEQIEKIRVPVDYTIINVDNDAEANGLTPYEELNSIRNTIKDSMDAIVGGKTGTITGTTDKTGNAQFNVDGEGTLSQDGQDFYQLAKQYYEVTTTMRNAAAQQGIDLTDLDPIYSNGGVVGPDLSQWTVEEWYFGRPIEVSGVIFEGITIDNMFPSLTTEESSSIPAYIDREANIGTYYDARAEELQNIYNDELILKANPSIANNVPLGLKDDAPLTADSINNIMGGKWGPLQGATGVTIDKDSYVQLQSSDSVKFGVSGAEFNITGSTVTAAHSKIVAVQESSEIEIGDLSISQGGDNLPVISSTNVSGEEITLNDSSKITVQIGTNTYEVRHDDGGTAKVFLGGDEVTSDIPTQIEINNNVVTFDGAVTVTEGSVTVDGHAIAANNEVTIGGTGTDTANVDVVSGSANFGGDTVSINGDLTTVQTVDGRVVSIGDGHSATVISKAGVESLITPTGLKLEAGAVYTNNSPTDAEALTITGEGQSVSLVGNSPVNFGVSGAEFNITGSTVNGIASGKIVNVEPNAQVQIGDLNINHVGDANVPVISSTNVSGEEITLNDSSKITVQIGTNTYEVRHDDGGTAKVFLGGDEVTSDIPTQIEINNNVVTFDGAVTVTEGSVTVDGNTIDVSGEVTIGSGTPNVEVLSGSVGFSSASTSEIQNSVGVADGVTTITSTVPGNQIKVPVDSTVTYLGGNITGAIPKVPVASSYRVEDFDSTVDGANINIFHEKGLSSDIARESLGNADNIGEAKTIYDGIGDDRAAKFDFAGLEIDITTLNKDASELAGNIKNYVQAMESGDGITSLKELATSDFETFKTVYTDYYLDKVKQNFEGNQEIETIVKASLQEVFEDYTDEDESNGNWDSTDFAGGLETILKGKLANWDFDADPLMDENGRRIIDGTALNARISSFDAQNAMQDHLERQFNSLESNIAFDQRQGVAMAPTSSNPNSGNVNYDGLLDPANNPYGQPDYNNIDGGVSGVVEQDILDAVTNAEPITGFENQPSVFREGQPVSSGDRTAASIASDMSFTPKTIDINDDIGMVVSEDIETTITSDDISMTDAFGRVITEDGKVVAVTNKFADIAEERDIFVGQDETRDTIYESDLADIDENVIYAIVIIGFLGAVAITGITIYQAINYTNNMRGPLVSSASLGAAISAFLIGMAIANPYVIVTSGILAMLATMISTMYTGLANGQHKQNALTTVGISFMMGASLLLVTYGVVALTALSLPVSIPALFGIVFGSSFAGTVMSGVITNHVDRQSKLRLQAAMGVMALLSFGGIIAAMTFLSSPVGLIIAIGMFALFASLTSGYFLQAGREDRLENKGLMDIIKYAAIPLVTLSGIIAASIAVFNSIQSAGTLSTAGASAISAPWAISIATFALGGMAVLLGVGELANGKRYSNKKAAAFAIVSGAIIIGLGVVSIMGIFSSMAAFASISAVPALIGIAISAVLLLTTVWYLNTSRNSTTIKNAAFKGVETLSSDMNNTTEAHQEIIKELPESYPDRESYATLILDGIKTGLRQHKAGQEVTEDSIRESMDSSRSNGKDASDAVEGEDDQKDLFDIDQCAKLVHSVVKDHIKSTDKEKAVKSTKNDVENLETAEKTDINSEPEQKMGMFSRITNRFRTSANKAESRMQQSAKDTENLVSSRVNQVNSQIAMQ